MLEIIFSIIVLLFSISLHETAHGFIAYKLGDPTAKEEGRLSLNPLKHLDLIGSLIFPLMTLILTLGKGPIFGWAKPVPVNPYNFRDQRWGQLKSAFAGPAINLLVAIISGLLIRFFLSTSVLLVPAAIIGLINMTLAIFNLVPIPPLDGSHILLSFFPKLKAESFFKNYGFILLFLFIFFGSNFIGPLVSRIFYFIAGF